MSPLQLIFFGAYEGLKVVVTLVLIIVAAAGSITGWIAFPVMFAKMFGSPFAGFIGLVFYAMWIGACIKLLNGR